MRTAYKCRAYPDEAQQQVLARTFGCVRVVWNRTLAARHAWYATESKSTSYAQTDAALTAMKRTPGLEWLNEVSSVPLQQTLRHQHKAFQAFFAKRARYPRFKSRHGKQSATYTRSAFSMRDGVLRLARTTAPLAFVWSWPDIGPAALNPTTVTVSRDPVTSRERQTGLRPLNAVQSGEHSRSLVTNGITDGLSRRRVSASDRDP